MLWHEITIYTREEATEAIADRLHQMGAGGVSIEESGNLERPRDTSLGQWYELPLNNIPEGDAEIKAYFADTADPEALIEQLKPFIGELPSFGLDPGNVQYSWRAVDEEDWANAWKTYFKPIRVTETLTIKPTWESYEPSQGEKIIELDPGMAFGTGTHETTALCLRTLEQTIRTGDQVIDVGTGSGVLAIAAARLGASRVLAIDLDPVAVSSASENVRLNGLQEEVTVRESDLLGLLKPAANGTAGRDPAALGVSLPVDLVVANILAEILALFVDDVYQALKPGGLYIASGIISQKEELVREALAKAGFTVVERNVEHDWVALTARKGG
ncbi:50S ribosomal protein L11 methyltransferase [Xylanibacillus composti]|uniref:Ribosomal protein L11 methyltransferase n=1 Tax=Xylanibacillus composti TaxID=1572762 RepID=A0A8J4H565_9BACL|nr:50S ribosomal protein L11 methyltransferase [Xylanibacillus composti]MDT9724444.1 50S ribosomal protein L11 methyltransferase [Xylanibacillus composti]GIQ69706.1 ribosomal protein L11 methyltransferase [Xylanibacillus composti]